MRDSTAASSAWRTAGIGSSASSRSSLRDLGVAALDLLVDDASPSCRSRRSWTSIRARRTAHPALRARPAAPLRRWSASALSAATGQRCARRFRLCAAGDVPPMRSAARPASASEASRRRIARCATSSSSARYLVAALAIALLRLRELQLLDLGVVAAPSGAATDVQPRLVERRVALAERLRAAAARPLAAASSGRAAERFSIVLDLGLAREQPRVFRIGGVEGHRVAGELVTLAVHQPLPAAGLAHARSGVPSADEAPPASRRPRRRPPGRHTWILDASGSPKPARRALAARPMIEHTRLDGRLVGTRRRSRGRR